ncbi:hypothetical protein CY34DRAFT_100491 [Suillus luteus UH-Slu-Lm8-n1]|uniref:Uncharacterized protein n=1 Tax=Suillus luteus UH-Slu-Lm8-n1 TaxID=930992 RepID=A0A0D0AM15_9AGAM|nr:hypothetical protein CY34DRAFT_100491 [Suillus luteus UH-Slu-Lm8-n1]
MRTCSTAGEYLRVGRIIRDGPYFAYPDRSRIRRYGDETFKQVIDARYASARSPTPATGSNSIPVENPRQDPKPLPTTSDIPSSAFVTESYFLQCHPVVGNHAVIVAVEEETDEQSAEALAVTRSKAKVVNAEGTNPDAQAVASPPRKSITSVPDPVLTSSPPSASTISSPAPPVFKYESKAASPDAAKRLYNTILNMPIQHLTVADLLSISPDLRKEAVEYSRTQRVSMPTTIRIENALASSLTNPPPPPN